MPRCSVAVSPAGPSQPTSSAHSFSRPEFQFEASARPRRAPERLHSRKGDQPLGASIKSKRRRCIRAVSGLLAMADNTETAERPALTISLASALHVVRNGRRRLNRSALPEAFTCHQVLQSAGSAGPARFDAHHAGTGKAIGGCGAGGCLSGYTQSHPPARHQPGGLFALERQHESSCIRQPNPPAHCRL